MTEEERFPGVLTLAALAGASPEWTEGYRIGWDTAGLCHTTKHKNSDKVMEAGLLRLVGNFDSVPPSRGSDVFHYDRYKDAGDGFLTGFKERLQKERLANSGDGQQGAVPDVRRRGEGDGRRKTGRPNRPPTFC